MIRRPTSRPGRGALDRLALVAVALVGFLLSDPGKVSADSRQYLYLDPGAFLERAVSLWDPSIAAGTVPHQHLGFLWPMGPFFWLADLVAMPTWVAQRLWLAGIAAAAGLGTLRLCRALGVGRVAALAAALAYQLTPYQLAFTARFSVLLLPWAALPWLVHLARRAVREATWRAPVWFGLVAATAGAVNASSLLLVLIAPVGLLLAAASTHGVRRALAAGARISVITLGASAWWIAGLVVQGRYGLPVLQLTENVDTVSAASAPDEVIRGLGNWIFVSTDGAATALEQSGAYQDSLPVRMATVALPAAALAALTLVRARCRGLVLGLLALATVVGVGAAPIADPSAYGELWRRFSESSSIGLALRNAPRIVPVVVLAVVVAIAIGIDSLRGRRRTGALVAVAAVVAVTIVPVARHGFLAADFLRPEEVPAHWTALAADLDAGDDRSRVLEIPGSNFAAYEWGNTVEPVLPGLIDRPTIAREVLPAGGAGTIDLLAALDRHLQRETLDPEVLAPVARLLGAGDIVVRGDLDAARFGLPDPSRLIRRFLADPPPGLRITGRYGGSDSDPLLLRLTAEDPVPRLRADGAAPVVLAGSGDGIVDAAAAGLVDGHRPILPAVTLDDAGLTDALARGGGVLVTDTARKRATTFFYTIARDTGATEPADRREPDPLGYDVRFGPYAEAAPDQQTTAIQIGGSVEASMGGGPEHPEDRAVHAFDGDPATAWRPRAVPVGQEVRVRLDDPTELDAVTILTAPGPARVTDVTLRVGDQRIDVALDERSLSAPGQPVAIDTTSVQEVAVEITATAGDGIPGLAEVGLGDRTVDEVLQVPTALTGRLGDADPLPPLTYLFTRDRGDQTAEAAVPVEADIDRLFEAPDAATFRLRGEATAATGAGSSGSCDGSFVRVDGDPVPVRVEVAEGVATVEGCEPLELSAGTHRIVTARNAAVTLDRLVLTTDDDLPGVPATVDRLQLATDRSRHLSGTIEGNDPYWLVLAESRNDGWELDVQGAEVVSEAMVDGYANGWLVRPAGATTELTLRWVPQRIVWAGFGISALTLAVALWLVLARRGTAPDPERLVDRRASWPRATAVPVAIALAAAAWFVAEPLVALVAVVALGARLATGRSTIALGVGAAAAVPAAELTDRPMLVYVALALVAAEIVGARIGDQGETATAEAPG